MKGFKILLVIGVLLGTVSCSKDYLDADLQTSKKFDDGIKTARDLKYLVAGVMSKLNNNLYYGRDMLMFGELRSDNAYNDKGTGRFIRVGEFNMLANDRNARETWEQIYSAIQQCNIVIQSTITEDDDVKFYKGQAHALRALCYFDLNRLYGQGFLNVAATKLGVPLVLVYDNTGTTPPKGRSTFAEVNAQIEADFLAGITLMNDRVTATNTMNPDAAAALLGRFYLYNKQYQNAINYTKPLLAKDYELFDSKLYVGSWSMEDTQESILELSYTQVDYHGVESYANMWANGGYKDVFGSLGLYRSFENTDVRFPAVFVPKSYPKIDYLIKYNYWDKDHNYRLVHLGEVIMNYVEACVELNVELDNALIEVNKLRNARGASLITALDLTSAWVQAERRRELSTEGHRYFDLLRTGQNINYLDATGKAAGTIINGSNACAFPIPEREMDANPNLTNQNPGY